MDDVRARLIDCFAAVFPDLSPGEVPQASVASVGSWDSLATVNLMGVLEEEFGVQVSPDDLPQLTSFELTLDYVKDKLR